SSTGLGQANLPSHVSSAPRSGRSGVDVMCGTLVGVAVGVAVLVTVLLGVGVSVTIGHGGGGVKNRVLLSPSPPLGPSLTSLNTSTVSVSGNEVSQEDGMHDPMGHSYSSNALLPYIDDTRKSRYSPALL